MRRRNFIQTVFGAVAGALLWPVRKIRAWRGRILVNGRPVPDGSMVQVAENQWHGKIDVSRLRPEDDLSVQFQRASVEEDRAVPEHVAVAVSLEF